MDVDIIISPTMVATANTDPVGGLVFGILALILSVGIVSLFIWLKERE